MKCAPVRGNQKYTCFSTKELIKIAKTYNRAPIGKKIKIKGQSKLQLWKNIRKALSDRCNEETCWIEQNFVKQMDDHNIEYNVFKPKMPDEWKINMKEWLSTDDINDVLKQYEKKYKDFFFVGPVPIDCNIDSTLMCQLTNFDINKMFKRGIYRVGITYNSDISSSVGEHWYSLYCDIPKRKITFFDSFGTKPPKEIIHLMERLQRDLEKGNNIHMKLEWNKKRHQYDSFSCGMYSIFFIIKMLEGKTLSDINKMKLGTNKMQKLRKVYYR